MCRLFINADSQLWTYRTKSLRIDGVVTSIRLEEFFWDILEELSFRDQMTVNQMITKLYLESLDADHDISNFTSF
ncbi:ribbon-helix-helix domain-containing protein [Psychrosphaera algicola]|uniref:Ribbon-helix-helix domain-containing protein n=1 Tax=Psychrosphaera algicola TaxID=3023714 RepID=A0ABT5FHX8_9GAMM|nr:ribbon-helix-helix domain-containing protein [Psychrosphaera sp. G1-22]MDC2890804.1 ribbon-helix-helix domain-containing protein [Psychrosphaera sp. G1-22]